MVFSDDISKRREVSLKMASHSRNSLGKKELRLLFHRDEGKKKEAQPWIVDMYSAARKLL